MTTKYTYLFEGRELKTVFRYRAESFRTGDLYRAAGSSSRVTILDRAGREASRADCLEVRVTDLQTGEIIFAKKRGLA